MYASCRDAAVVEIVHDVFNKITYRCKTLRSCCLRRQSYLASSSSEELDIKRLSFSEILRFKIHLLRNLQLLVRRVLSGFRLFLLSTIGFCS